jgi:osmotically inducible lipoprotein OsmB
MRKFLFIASLVAAAALPSLASAASNSERTATGAVIGGTARAVIAGPVGAVAGGTVGAVIGGPRISGRHRVCWRDGGGDRHCAGDRRDEARNSPGLFLIYALFIRARG